MTKAQKETAALKARMKEIETICARAMRGPARAQEHYTAALRQIEDIVKDALCERRK